MTYKAKIIADSISESGCRITTFVVVLPRLILSEWNTHRVFSRNSASSRAIPVIKQLRAIVGKPFVPAEFGVNKPGMQTGDPLKSVLHDDAVAVWLEARDNAVLSALKLMTSAAFIKEEFAQWQAKGKTFNGFVLSICRRFEKKDPAIFDRPDFLNVHKGLTNRLLEPFMWHTIIVTATEWDNFYALRTSNDAQLEIRTIAKMMKAAHDASTPVLVKGGEWHLPFLQNNEKEWAKSHPEEARLAVAARCARVSYLTHDTGEADLEKDLALAKRLSASGHMSPFEHAATPAWHMWHDTSETFSGFVLPIPSRMVNDRHGNFVGWKQHRQMLPNEADFSKVVQQ